MNTALCSFCVAGAFVLVSCSARGETVTLYRDEYGVPHVYAETDAGAAYALGYAQAEDRLEQLLWNYRLAYGTLAEAFGPDYVETDKRQRLAGHMRICRARYGEIAPELRAIIEAFQDGVRAYMQEHPEDVPPWAPELEPAMAVALGRTIIFNWPIGTAMEELGRKDPDFAFASNEWALRPENTTEGCAILCIDPHIGWSGPFRFYECRVHGDRLHVSGFAPLGAPVIGLGHNERLGWACTTGGPDTADIYIEQLDPDSPGRYLCDGESLLAEVYPETINVAGGEAIVLPVMRTRHGVVVEVDEAKGLAYVIATPYLDEIGLVEQLYRMSVASNLDEFKEAVAMLQLMEQNIMYADVEGNIFYIRNGRVPIRPDGYDFSRPVPGNTTATDWLGIHPLSDLIQIENPSVGYMQNCNISPARITRGRPVDPAEWPAYLFNVTWDDINTRGARALRRLAVRHKITFQEAFDICLDTAPYAAKRWANATIAAAAALPDHPDLPSLGPALEILREWDGRLMPDSIGPVLLVLQWRAVPDADTAFRKLAFQSQPLTTDEQATLLSGLAEAVRVLEERKGRIDVPWGEVFVIARGNRSVPAAGGEIGSMEALRMIGFDFDEEAFRGVGARGSSWTQLVFFRPEGVESYSITPWGQSDHPDSRHYFDQAALYAKPGMKPTWFSRQSLSGHIRSEKRLDYAPQ